MTTETLPQSQSYAERALRCDFILDQPNTMEILTHKLMEGESVKAIARTWDVPHGRLSAWILADEERARQYFDAQRIHAHTLVSETVEIADTADTESKAGMQKAKLKIEVRFQVASYHDKARYGEQAKGGGGTRVNVIVQRHPQPTLTLTAQSQEAPHGDHSSSVTDSLG